MVQTPNGYSICVVFYNEGEAIQSALEGLALSHSKFSSRHSHPVEYLFIDNNSNGKSSPYIHSFSEMHNLSFKIFKSSLNNMGKARNLALANAEYENLIFLDADCRPQEDWLVNFHAAYVDHMKDGVVAIGGENAPPKTGHSLYLCIRLLKRFPFLHLKSNQISSAVQVQQVNHVPTCNVLYLKQSLLDVDGFCESFVRVGEDLDLNMRLISSGKKILFIEGVTVEHHDKKSFLKWFLKIFGYGSAQPEIILRHPFEVGIYRWIPLVLMGAIVTGLFISTMVTIYFLLFFSLILPMVSILRQASWKLIFPWIYFLNGTIFSYLTGYLFGVCTIPLRFLKLRNAKIS